MKFHKYLTKNSEKPTKEMFDFYKKRTKEHIDKVKKNIRTIISKRNDLNTKELEKRINIHDKSKYSKEEYIPYVYLTWWHKEKNAGRKYEYPEGIKDKVKNAWKAHEKANRHHPGFHKNPKDMLDVDIAEMIADWAAMSQEIGTGLKKWADTNVGKKWKFTTQQTKLIYELIGIFE